jgi:hypothetical protein
MAATSMRSSETELNGIGTVGIVRSILAETAITSGRAAPGDMHKRPELKPQMLQTSCEPHEQRIGSRTMKDIKHIAIVILVGLALLLQLMYPTLVHADGEVTPQPSQVAPEPTEAPADVVLADPPVVDPPIATPIAPTAVPPQATPTPEPLETVEVTLSAPEPTEPPPPSDAAVDEPVLLESVEGISGATSVNIVDENGQTLPLATQYAANALENGDPIWCPAGQPPTPWINGCTGNFDFTTFSPITTLSQLLSAYGSYINNQFVDGTIWITSGNVNDTNPITINGSLYTNWANYGLTLQGGWSGINGDTTIGSNSVFSVPIWIYNWRDNLIVDNITINDANALGWYALVVQQAPGVAANTTISDTVVTGSIGTGLNVSNFGTVTVRNSTFSGNHGRGADIGWGNISIINSHFDNNEAYGLHAISGSNVFIDGSTFNDNLAHGVDISNASNITISNSSFSGNTFSGSMFYNAGNVLLSYSAFDRNGGNVAEIDSAGGVAFNNSTFSGNTFSGSLITSANNVLISNSLSEGNGRHGAEISFTGDVTFDNSSFFGNSGNGALISDTSLVMIHDTTFEANGGNGAEIYSSGDVTVDNSYFDGNTGTGLTLSNLYTIDIYASTFSGNFGDSLSISDIGTRSAPVQSGNISIYDIYAENINIQDVHLQYGSIFVGTYNNTNIVIDNVTVDSASGFGLGVDTYGGSVTIKDSSFTNTVADENALLPWGDGADIFTGGGNITVTNSDFVGNSFDGLFVDTDSFDANGNLISSGNIVIDQSHFNQNRVGGLDVASANTIKVTATEFTANASFYDLFAFCDSDYLSLVFDDFIPTFPALIDIFIDTADCENYISNIPKVQISQGSDPVTIEIIRNSRLSSPEPGKSPESFIELFLCFAGQESHTIPLPNGDKVEIICPVSGKAAISRLDNITLPQELPEGYTFASGYEVKILQRVPGGAEDQRVPIDVITEGGHIKVSFVAPQFRAQIIILFFIGTRRIRTGFP